MPAISRKRLFGRYKIHTCCKSSPHSNATCARTHATPPALANHSLQDLCCVCALVLTSVSIYICADEKEKSEAWNRLNEYFFLFFSLFLFVCVCLHTRVQKGHCGEFLPSFLTICYILFHRTQCTFCSPGPLRRHFIKTLESKVIRSLNDTFFGKSLNCDCSCYYKNMAFFFFFFFFFAKHKLWPRSCGWMAWGRPLKFMRLSRPLN